MADNGQRYGRRLYRCKFQLGMDIEFGLKFQLGSSDLQRNGNQDN